MKTISIKRLKEFFRYGIGCACNLFFKIAVTACFTFFSAPVWLGYLGAQILVLFVSYFYHTYITFQRHPKSLREHWGYFASFTGALLIFKLADYFFVVLGDDFLNEFLDEYDLLTPEIQQLTVAGLIIMASGFIFFFRYLLYCVVFRRTKRQDSESTQK